MDEPARVVCYEIRVGGQLGELLRVQAQIEALGLELLELRRTHC